jgi:hypothetical protein
MLLLALCLLHPHAQAQNSLSVCGGIGLNKIVTHGPLTKMGYFHYVGLEVDIKGGQHFHFMPSLSFNSNNYYALIGEMAFLKLTQRAIDLGLPVGVAIDKKTILTGGIFLRSLFNSYCMITYRRPFENDYAFSNSGMYEYYSPRQLQAGISLGLARTVGKKGRTTFNFQLQQHVVSILEQDFELRHYYGYNTICFWKRSLPLAVSIGLSYALKHRSKSKSEEESH